MHSNTTIFTGCLKATRRQSGRNYWKGYIINRHCPKGLPPPKLTSFPERVRRLRIDAPQGSIQASERILGNFVSNGFYVHLPSLETGLDTLFGGVDTLEIYESVLLTTWRAEPEMPSEAC